MSKKNKVKWSKKRKIFTWTIAPTASIIVGGVSVVGAIAGVKLHALNQEQTAFNQVLAVSNTSLNGKHSFDPGIKKDETNETNLGKMINEFTHPTHPTKTISVGEFANKLQDNMVSLFSQFKIKLENIKTQIANSPLNNYPQMQLLKNGFVVDSINLIDTYTKIINTKTSNTYESFKVHTKAFSTFYIQLGNLIKTYMVLPLNNQLSANGDFAKYNANPNSDNAQNLLITLLYDHTINDIANALFRQSIEAPELLMSNLIKEGYSSPQPIVNASTNEPNIHQLYELLYLQVLTGAKGIEHISDVYTLSSVMDGLISDANNNLADILKHPIFHTSANNESKKKIQDITTVLKDLFNNFVEVPQTPKSSKDSKTAAQDLMDQANLYIKNDISVTALYNFVKNEESTHTLSFLSDAVNDNETYSSTSNMKAFLSENANHFRLKNDEYFKAMAELANQNIWFPSN